MRESVPARELVLLLLASALLRGALLAAAGVRGPLGGDLPYWGYAAAEWQQGIGPATHPPLLPTLAGLADLVAGAGLVWPQWGVVLLCGAALPPAVAWAVGRVDGARAGRLAGLLTLCLPATAFASVQVEPLAPALCWLSLLLVLAVAVARGAGLGAAVALGAVGVLSAATKEGGPVDMLALTLPAVLLAPGRRLDRALGVGLGAVLAAILLSVLASGAGFASKSALPFADMRAWIQHGQVPPPLTQPGDPVGPLSPELVARFSAASPLDRLPLALGVQAWRLLALLGPWALLVPWGLVRLVALARGGIVPWAVAGPVLARGLAVAGGLLIVIQGRHAEWLALGGLWAVAIALARAGRAARIGALALAGGWMLAHLPGTVDHLARLHQQARDEERMAAWAAAQVPEDALLLATLHCVGAWTGRTTRPEHHREALAGAPAWLVARMGEVGEEGIEAAPTELEPLCLSRQLQAPTGRFGLFATRTEPCPEAFHRDALDAAGALTLADEAGDGSKRRRPRPGRSRGEGG